MKRFAVVGVLVLTLFLTGCFGPRRMSQEQQAQIVDQMASTAHSIVSAKLISRSPFDEQTEEHIYELEEVHAGQTVPETFHVLDQANDRLEEGRSYYLILNRTDNALYPFPLYSSRNHLLLTQTGEEELSVFRDQPVTPEEFSVPTYLNEQIIASQLILTRPQNLVEVSETEDLSEVLEQADRVWEAKLTSEKTLNPYVSEYAIELIDVLKGEGPFMTVQMLPAGLDVEQNYLIPERAFSAGSTSYMPFATSFPVIAVDSEDGQAALDILG